MYKENNTTRRITTLLAARAAGIGVRHRQRERLNDRGNAVDLRIAAHAARLCLPGSAR